MRKELAGFLSIVCLAGFILPAAAGATETAPKPASKPPFRIACGTSRFIQKYSGLTWLTNTCVSALASAALTAWLGGRVHARVKTYSLTDLFDGEFESVDVKLAGSKWEGVPVGRLHAATTGPFKLHYFQRKGHNSGLRTPLLLSLQGEVSQRDLSRGLHCKKIVSVMRFLKLDLPGLGEQRLQILEPKVELEGDKVRVNSWLVTAGADRATGIPLEVLATPHLVGERFIQLNDMKVSSTEIVEPQEFAHFAEELLNPLVDFGRMDTFDHALRFSKLDIANERVKFEGRLLLAPKPTGKAQFSAPFQMAQQSTATPDKK